MLVRLMILVLIAVPHLARGAEPVAEEYQVKGAFLLNFTKFVDWPPQVFEGPGAPIAIYLARSSIERRGKPWSESGP